ncbi:MAG TPA: hypothetical protein VJ888_01475 [Mobilitalea sp.]|nr:hypothetical protein [Mobilitalea sp.]
MFRLRKMKSLAILMILCLFSGMINTKAYAESSSIAPKQNKADLTINSFATGALGTSTTETVTGSAIYVGGASAEAGNGSSTAPFLTLNEAADAINTKGTGSYQIIMQGDTTETKPVSFGSGSDVSITVSGSAIQVSKAFTYASMFYVTGNATLSLEGCSNTQQLIFDGGGESYKGAYALFRVFPDGTLNLNKDACVQNNVISASDGLGAGIYNEGTLVMDGGSVSSNVCPNKGGGIYNTGTFLLESGTISNNTGSDGTGIYNAGTMTINGGTVTQNSQNCLFNAGTVTMNAGNITGNDGCITVLNSDSGFFDMKGGSISNNKDTAKPDGFSAISVNGGGKFNLTGGGNIKNNTGGQIISVGDGSFNMTGGTISNNTASVGVIRTTQGASFTMSDGVINDNIGKAFYMNASISLSDNASITGEDGGIASISINNYSSDSCINVSGSLSNITSLNIKSELLKEGKQILIGTGLTEELISKFKIEDTNYSIDNTGKLVYIGEPLTLYVDAAGSDNASRKGSSSEPLLTINEAIKRIGSSNGTIIVQSDLDVIETIIICTNITIKSDGQSSILYQRIPYSGSGFGSMFHVIFGDLTLGDKEQTTGELIIESDLNEIPKLIDLANGSTVALCNNAVIQNCKLTDGVIYNNKSTFILDGGSINKCTGTVINNFHNGTVNIVAGTISAATEANDFGIGILNEVKDTGNTESVENIINMSGGTITGFDGAEAKGIYNKGELNLSGGTINNNTTSIVNEGSFLLSGNASIPAETDNMNKVYLSGSGITLSEGLLLSDDNQTTIILNNYIIGTTVLQGDSDAIKNNCDNFILADNQYGVSEEGNIIYIGVPPTYYVDAGYSGGDSDGSIDKPFTYLEDAAYKINSTVRVGTIYICSDLELTDTISISSAITILNYGTASHTITRSGLDLMFYISSLGMLTLGSEEAGSDDNPSLLLYGIAGEGITKAACFIINTGKLNLYSGVKLYGNESPDNNNAGAILNDGEFHMYGGIITNNTGINSGGIINIATFIMEGGSISNCNGSIGGAVINEDPGTFIMKGGTINNNNNKQLGVSIYNRGSIHISEDASIPMGEGGSNNICLDNYSYVIIDKDLNSTDKILLTTAAIVPGRRLLGGDVNILSNNYQKFILDPSMTSYRLAEDGTLVFLGSVVEYYVDQAKGKDANAGTLTEPFATLGKAVSSIEDNSGVGTVHICSNLELAEPVVINGAITLLNEGEPHIILRSAKFSVGSGFDTSYLVGMLTVLGKLELGNAEADGNEETTLLTMDGNRSNISDTGALISNYGSLTLHNGILLQNNASTHTGGIYNEGSLTMKGGVIQFASGQVGAGGIYNYMADATIMGGYIINNSGNHGGGITSEHSTLNILGGNIINNIGYDGGGIHNVHSSLNISGGSIVHNRANYGGGLYLRDTDAIMSGGEISENQLAKADDAIGKGVYIDQDATFTVLKDASIASDNDVTLYEGEYWKSIITVGDSLSENIPVIMVKEYNYDIDTGIFNYHPGDQVVKQGDGYTLTTQDISKFSLTDSNYVINNLGKIASALSEVWISMENTDQLYYTGSEIKPAVSVVNGTKVLTEGTNYQVSYKDNVNAGTATVNIDGMGKYGGRVSKTFTINKAVVQSISTSAPADQIISASEGRTANELLTSLALNNVTVNLNDGTAILPITWALTTGTYNSKGGIYTFTGTLNGNENIDAGGKKLTAKITVTPVTLSKPIFEDITVTAGTDGQATANELGSTVLPTSGTIQADNTIVNYTIAWDDSTLKGSTVGASNIFHGTITYMNAPVWATLPSDLSVSRKVRVTAADIVVTPPQEPGGDSTQVLTPTPTPKVSPTPSGTYSERNAEVSVKIVQNKQKGEINASFSIPLNSVQDLIDGAGASEQTVVTIPIASEELTGLLHNNSFTSANIDLIIPDSITQSDAIAGYHVQLDADIIEAAKETEKDVHISVKDEKGTERYSWNFAGTDLAASDNAVADLDLSLEVERVEDNQELSELLGQGTNSDNDGRNNVVIDFGYHGELPAQASVRINVRNMGFSEGDTLYLYYYNTETGKLDTLPYNSDYQVDSEGYVTIDITHCSEYVLLPEQADAGIITSLRNQISITPDKLNLYLGSKDPSTAMINIKLPDTLEQVKDLKAKTSGSAIGGVVITYKSSNPKVASVDSSGNMVAKKVGEAVITVTATLYSGKTKTFKIPITVKKPYILLSSSTDTIKVGESFTFTAKAYGLDIKNIEWRTTKKSIVIINKKTGKASGVKKGTDYIIASINNITCQIKVTVK